jgi:hypothetical protein
MVEAIFKYLKRCYPRLALQLIFKTQRLAMFIAKNIGIIGCEMLPSKQKGVIQ